MSDSVDFKFLGDVEIEELQERTRALPAEAWSSSIAAVAQVHAAATHAFMKVDMRQEHFYGREWAMMDYFESALEPVRLKIEEQLGDGYIKWAHLAKHEAGFGFPEHTDWFSYTLINAHRMHMAVLTNDDVCFAINGDKRNLKEGELWEIDNAGVHGGFNGGKTPRVHLIVDFIRQTQSPDEIQRYLMNMEATARRSGLVLLRPHNDNDEIDNSPVADLGKAQQAAAESRVDKDVIVGLNYVIKDSSTGSIVSLDETPEPLAFLHGRGQLPAILEKALIGKKVGETVDITLRPEEGYGSRHDDLVVEVNKEDIQPLIDLDDRQGFMVSANNGGEPSENRLLRNFFIAPAQGDEKRDTPLVAHSHGSKSTLDANHPYAGRTFDIEARVAYVRAPRQDEANFAIWSGGNLASQEDRLRGIQRLAASSTEEIREGLSTTPSVVPVPKHRGGIPKLDN